MKTPTWQLSTLPRCPHHCRLTPDRVRAALGETARIEGDDASGLAQLMDYLRHQYLDQGTVIPWRGAHELLDDLALDINERGDVLGIFVGQVRQQPLEIAV